MSTGFDRDRGESTRGARTVIVLPDQGDAVRDAEARLEETAGLAMAIGLDVVERVAVRVRAPKPATLIGSGQVEQIAQQVRMEEAQLVVFDASLTPVQQRNLETALEAKVIDRTGLILEIFGERAATAEGGCRSNSPISTIRRAVWCAAGPTWNANAVASASWVVRARRRSRRIDA